jgi:hypothetical protein
MIHIRADYNDRIQDKDGLIPDYEPVFLIRAQDMAAYETVIAWAVYNERRARQANLSPNDLQASLHLSAVAQTHAKRMKEWPKKKLADAPPTQKRTRTRKKKTDEPDQAESDNE